jgi:CopG family nickel-responsive transcriptional regulator
MAELVRFGVSMDDALLRRFDALIARGGLANRSEAVRDLVRARLIEEDSADPEAPVFGVLTLVYDHHRRDLQDRLVTLQHDHVGEIISSTHVHIDHDNCLEVILLRGPSGVVRRIGEELAGFKGVEHGRLVLTSVHG